MIGTWIYADPEKPPADGLYWTRWARRQERLIRRVEEGKVYGVPDFVFLSWALFVKQQARQYFTAPIAEPPDLWIEQEPPKIHGEWDAAG